MRLEPSRLGFELQARLRGLFVRKQQGPLWELDASAETQRFVATLTQDMYTDRVIGGVSSVVSLTGSWVPTSTSGGPNRQIRRKLVRTGSVGGRANVLRRAAARCCARTKQAPPAISTSPPGHPRTASRPEICGINWSTAPSPNRTAPTTAPERAEATGLPG